MDTLALKSFSSHCWMRLTGPIFDKELRVCSRRKRYYVLRSFYLAVMGVLVLIAWLTKSSSLGWQNSAYNTSRMAEVGRSVITSLVWFQFIVSQIAAILFFSNAICDEMNRGTLNVLMTTPITTLQIVMGKLLSKLIQLILILALSLSTLSIVYIFGGVHWEYIISSFTITLTAVIFTGTMTLFCSCRLKHSHTVVLMMITFICVYYAMGPSLISLLSNTPQKGAWLLMANPMAAMYEITQPRVTGVVLTGKEFSWGMHCLVMLGLSMVLIIGTVIGLRKSMLTFAFEKGRNKRSRWYRIKQFFVGQKSQYPIELKHFSKTRSAHSLREMLIFMLLTFGFLAGYCCLYLDRDGFGAVVFRTYSMALWLIVFVRTMVGASTAITAEKENKSLSALLCCPIKSSQIIVGKAKKVYRNNYTGWAVLALNSAAAYVIYSQFIYPSASFGPGGVVWVSIFSVFNVIGSLIFIIGFGLFLSVRLKSSTAALIAGLLGYLLWYYLRYVVLIIPTLISSIMGIYMISFYIRPFVDIAAGLFFAWRAQRLLRKYAFR